MERAFSVKKEKEPASSVEDASDRVTRRGDTIDEKIKKLDVELGRYKEQIKRMRPGPAQEAKKARAMRILKQKRTYEGQRDMLCNESFKLDQVAFAAEGIKNKDAQQTRCKTHNSRQCNRSFKFTLFGTCCLPHERCEEIVVHTSMANNA